MPAAKKEQGLEEGVGHQVEEAADDIAGPHRQKHVAHLADGGVGQHLFDVPLGQGGKGGVKGGDGAHPGNDQHGRGRERHQGKQPHEQIGAGGDHGGGVNQGRDRGGAGHGIRQPHGQGQLRRFAQRRPEQQQGQEW